MNDRALVIAEAGVNHDGDMNKAQLLIEAAAKAGADVVKFQTFKADFLAKAEAPKALYQLRTTDQAETQFDMLRNLELPRDMHVDLALYAKKLGLEFLSSPFDDNSLRYLLDENLVQRVKIPSSDLTNIPLLQLAARSELPILLSTGLATLGEIEKALQVLCHAVQKTHEDLPDRNSLLEAWSEDEARDRVLSRVTLLQCTSEYPAPLANANLRAMVSLGVCFNTHVGFSDHSEGIGAAIGSVALGGRVVEKHLTLDRSAPGPDHAASMEPPAFAQMVAAIREVETAMGSAIKGPRGREITNRTTMRKGIYLSRDKFGGQEIYVDDLVLLRPEGDVDATQWLDVVGKWSASDRARGEHPDTYL